MASAGFTSITGTKFQNAAGQPLASGRVICWPVNNQSQPVSATVSPSAGGGIIAVTPVTFLIAGGTITTDQAGNPPQLADTSQTNPPNIGYKVRVIDAYNNVEVQGPGYECVQPRGPSFSFDTYTPFQPTLTAVTSGPQGPAGLPGKNGSTGPAGPPLAFSGDYDPSLVYAVGAAVYYTDGSSYVSIVSGNQGNTPANSPTFWHLQARAGDPGTVTSDGTNGGFIVGGPLTAKQLIGERVASGYETGPGTNDALTNALAGAAPGTKITFDPAYTGQDYLPEVQIPQNIEQRSVSSPAKTYVRDRRSGVDISYALNNWSNNASSAFTFASRYDTAPSLTSGAVTGNMAFSIFFGSEGAYTYGKESGGDNVNLYTTASQKGIHQVIGSTFNKYGIGDAAFMYGYNNYWGGSINGDDEGFTVTALHLSEGGSVFSQVPTATVSVIGNPAAPAVQFLRLSNASSKSWGAGRYILRMKDSGGNDLSIGSYTITSHDYLSTLAVQVPRITVAETIPSNQICSSYGNTDPFAVPYNNDAPQLVSNVTYRIATGSGDLVPGIACMVGEKRNQRVLIVSAPASQGGVQTISFYARYGGLGVVGGDLGGEVACVFFQDPGGQASGLGQSMARIAAWDQGFGKPNVSVPVVGAIDAHTIIYVANSTIGPNEIPGIQEAMPLSQTVTITRDGNGTATVTSTGYRLQQFQKMPVSVVGSSDPSLVPPNPIVMTPSNATVDSLTYPSAGPAITTPVSATLVGGLGRNVVKLYRGVEVTRTTDNTQTTDNLGTFIGLEPNNIPFNVGDVLEHPGHYAVFWSMSTEYATGNTPSTSTSSKGKALAVSGNVVNEQFNFYDTANNNPASMYVGSGGFLGLPTLHNIAGPFQSLFTWDGQGGGNRTLFNVGFADTSLANVSLNGYQVQTANGYSRITWNQSNDVFTIEWVGGNYISFSRTDGWAFHTSVDMGNNQLKNMKAGTDPNDAVTLAQVQALIAAAIASKA